MQINKPEDLKMISAVCRLRAWVKGALPFIAAHDRLTLKEAQISAVEFGYLVDEQITNNLITTSGLSQVVKQLTDDEATGITMCALGTTDTAVTIADVALNQEVARKAITTREDSGATADFSTFFTAAECTYYIEEIGLFAGASATTSAESGRMFNHWLQEYDNSLGTYDLTIDVTLTVARST